MLDPISMTQKMIRYADIRNRMNVRDVIADQASTASVKVVELAFAEHRAQAQPISLRCLKDGGRYRIRTYDFHRVKMALYR
jgi:hypothetical protein